MIWKWWEPEQSCHHERVLPNNCLHLQKLAAKKHWGSHCDLSYLLLLQSRWKELCNKEEKTKKALTRQFLLLRGSLKYHPLQNKQSGTLRSSALTPSQQHSSAFLNTVKEIVSGGLIPALLKSQKLSYPLKLPFLSNSNNWRGWWDAEAHSRMFHFQWVLWRLVDKTWMPLVFQASKASSKAPHCQNYHHSGTKLWVITGAELRHNELLHFHWTLLHWTDLPQQRGWPTAVRVKPP